MSTEPQVPEAAPDSHAPAVLRSTALQVGGHAIAIVLQTAATIVLTRFLGVDDYGRFTVLTVFLLIGVSVSEFGLNGTAVRWFARGDPPREVFSSLIGLRLLLSSLAALAALAVYALYPHHDAPLPAVVLTAVAMIVAGVNLTLPTVLQARLDFRLVVGLDVTARTVSFAVYALAALLITAHDPDKRLVAAAAGLAIGYLAAALVGLLVVQRLALPVVPTFHRHTWRRLLRDAAPLGLVVILGLASYRLDALVLAALQDAHDVGIYGLAYRFMEASIPLGLFVVAAVFPLLVKDEADSGRRAAQVARAADLLLIVGVGVAAATFVLAPDLVRLLGGSAYAAAVEPLRILVLSLPFTFTAGLMSWTLIARGLQQRLIPITAAALTLNLVLNLALVPTYSYTASASVTLGVEILGALVLVVLVRRWLHVSPDPRTSTKILVAGLVALALGLVCARVGGALVATVATLLVFGGLVLAFGLVTRDEVRALTGRDGG